MYIPLFQRNIFTCSITSCYAGAFRRILVIIFIFPSFRVVIVMLCRPIFESFSVIFKLFVNPSFYSFTFNVKYHNADNKTAAVFLSDVTGLFMHRLISVNNMHTQSFAVRKGLSAIDTG